LYSRWEFISNSHILGPTIEFAILDNRRQRTGREQAVLAARAVVECIYALLSPFGIKPAAISSPVPGVEAATNDGPNFAQHARMSKEEVRRALRQADQARTDFAAIESDLDFLMQRISHLPTAADLWRATLLIAFVAGVLGIVGIEARRRRCSPPGARSSCRRG
jgi:hypothetical protein